MVKSLYTLRRRHNEAKSIVSTGCYPVDTVISKHLYNEPTCQISCEQVKRFLSYYPDKLENFDYLTVAFISYKLTMWD